MKKDKKKKSRLNHPAPVLSPRSDCEEYQSIQKGVVKNLTRGFRVCSEGDIPSDIQGSWTGNPEDGGEPVQDADDL